VTKVVPDGYKFLVLLFHWTDFRAPADTCILLTTAPRIHLKDHKNCSKSIITHINSKFQILYLAHQDISVKELLTLWKGCLSFKQYLPLRLSQFRIKIWIVWITFWLSDALHTLYFICSITAHIQQHTYSNCNSTGAFWTPVPQRLYIVDG
jgi:hypothetical protein